MFLDHNTHSFTSQPQILENVSGCKSYNWSGNVVFFSEYAIIRDTIKTIAVSNSMQMFRLVFRRFLDLRGNLGNIKEVVLNRPTW